MYRPQRLIDCCLAILLGAGMFSASASGAEDMQWLNPTIKNFGRVVDLDSASVPLNPARNYKLLFNVTQAARSNDAVPPALERVARFINLAALAELPPEKLDLAVVISGPALYAVLNEAAYAARFDGENVSLPLLQALHEAGVRILVCGQAMAQQGLTPDELAPSLEMAVAALTVNAELQLDGYLLMPE